MVDILMITKQPRMTPEAIKRLAVKYRNLIRESDRSQWGPQFRDFPGACGDVSEMFGTYLFERCGVNAKYVSSVEGTGFDGTHAWLELGDLIIDLTCDQFPQYCPNNTYKCGRKNHTCGKKCLHYWSYCRIYILYAANASMSIEFLVAPTFGRIPTRELPSL